MLISNRRLFNITGNLNYIFNWYFQKITLLIYLYDFIAQMKDTYLLILLLK